MTDHVDNWIGDRFFNGDREDECVSMKPLLAKLMQEAFSIAVADSIPDISDERSVAIYRDIHSLTDEEWALVNPTVLCQNIACRFMGRGGNIVRGVYAGNVSLRETFDVCVGNTEANETDRLMGQMRAGGLEAFPISDVEDLKDLE